MRSSFVPALACALISCLANPCAESADRRQPQSPGKSQARDVMLQGKAVYDQWCIGCHGPMPGMGRFPPAGSYRLQQRYKDAKPAMLEERVDLTAALIRTVVRQGLPIMPPLRKTEVTDAELDAVIAHLTHGTGN
jgi:mono/diheme cytochrome c family protein